MIDYEISRLVYPKAVDRINNRVAVNITKLGLRGVVQQIELEEGFRVPVSRPGGVEQLLAASNSTPSRLETYINSSDDNKYADGKLRFQRNWTVDRNSGSPSSKLVFKAIDDVNPSAKALDSVKAVVAAVDVNPRLTYSPTRIVGAFERYNLGGVLYSRRSPGIPMAWLLPELDDDLEVQEKLEKFKATIRREVGNVGLHPAELFPSTLEASCEEPA